MPRAPRKKSPSGIYHIILRGQNRQIIFVDNEDGERFLQTLSECKSKSGFKLYGYCLMGNHVHLLLHESEEKTDRIMKRLGTSYVYWYNWKYKRCGHLFQDRYRSEPVETDSYFLTVLRYIHRNPVKAGLATDLSDYKWSSYTEYIMSNNGISDIDFALSLISEHREKAVDSFIKFHYEQKEDYCLDIKENPRLTDEEGKEIIKNKCGIECGQKLKDFKKEERDECIRKLLAEGLSTRQIQRLTGISRSIVLGV